jgi:hypothetical protein
MAADGLVDIQIGSNQYACEAPSCYSLIHRFRESAVTAKPIQPRCCEAAHCCMCPTARHRVIPGFSCDVWGTAIENGMLAQETAKAPASIVILSEITDAKGWPNSIRLNVPKNSLPNDKSPKQVHVTLPSGFLFPRWGSKGPGLASHVCPVSTGKGTESQCNLQSEHAGDRRFVLHGHRAIQGGRARRPFLPNHSLSQLQPRLQIPQIIIHRDFLLVTPEIA